MANIYTNAASGTITDNPLTNVATTVNSAGFANLPAVVAPDTMLITMDPTGVGGLPEIMLITAHTASSTTITVTRGQQVVANLTSAARQHNVGTIWRHAATAADLNDLPHRLLTTAGDTLYASGINTPARLAIGATGTKLVVVGGVPTWQAETTNYLVDAKGDVLVGTADNTLARVPVGSDGLALLADSTQTPGVKWNTVDYSARGVNVLLRRLATQTIAANSDVLVIWDTEDADASGFIVAPSTTLTVPSGLGGLYIITATVSSAAAGVIGGLTIVANGVAYSSEQAGRKADPGSVTSITALCPLVPTSAITVTATNFTGSSTTITGNLAVARLSL